MQQLVLIALVCCSLAVALHPPSDEYDSICSLPPVEPLGYLCRAYIPKFTFNPVTGSCESYVYGGCRGTKNLFDTYSQCVRKCLPRALPPHLSDDVATLEDVPVAADGPKDEKESPVSESGVIPVKSEDICSLPPVKTPHGLLCMNFAPSWTFNMKTNRCEFFMYDGCYKTANLFSTKEECEVMCPRVPNFSKFVHLLFKSLRSKN